MGIIRSITTRLGEQPNIEYRVGKHTPKEGDAFAVVEVYHRSAAYEITDGDDWKMIGRYTMDQFLELSRDVARIGMDIIPPKKKKDKASGDEAVS